MKFKDFTFIGRTLKCAVLQTSAGKTVYCLFPIIKYLMHNPSLKWDVVEKVHPKNNKTYSFIHLSK